MNSDLDPESKEGKARYWLTRVWTWVGIVLLFGVGVFVSGVLSNAIGIIIWTVVFVFILRGPVNWLDARGVNRTVGTVLSYVLFVALLALLLFVVFSPVFGINAQFEELAKSLPGYIEEFQKWSMEIYERYADVLQNDSVRQWITDAGAQIGGFVQSFASTTASGLVAAGGAVANIALCIGFALVIAFWMLIELPKLGPEMYRIIGEKRHADAEMVYLTVTRAMGGYLKATLIQCAIIGIACGVMFWALGVPSPAALGVITGLLNIIPIIGPWLGGALAFVASVVASPVVGIIALIGTIVIQQLIYTFLSPKLMGDSVDIHPAFTFIALTAGSGIGTAMGGLIGALVGALLSIPLVAILKSFFVYFFEKRTGRQIVSEDGVFFRGATAKEGELNPIVDATGPISVESTSVTGRIRGLTGKIPKVEPPDDREAHGDHDRPAHKRKP